MGSREPGGVEGEQRLERLRSGVPGLDEVLRGGLFRGGLYLIMGGAGTGKTVLGNQLCFTRAAAGERAVYVTVHSEAHARMLQHMGSLDFFDQAMLGGAITYLSGTSSLATDGLDGFLGLVRREILDRHASLLIVETLGSLADIASAGWARTRVLRELGALANLTGCTVIVSASRTAEFRAEELVPDGVLVFARRRVGSRVGRELEVIKHRGSDLLLGRHPYEITGAGMRVFPRLEARRSHRRPELPERPRPLGVPELDALLGPGKRPSSALLVLGPPGPSLRRLGVRFLLAGAGAGEPGVYVGPSVSRERVLTRSRSTGLDLGPLVASSKVSLLGRAHAGVVIEQLASHIEVLVRRGARRVFIDGLGELQAATLEPTRSARALAAMLDRLAAHGVITLVTDLSASGVFPARDVAGAFDHVLVAEPREGRLEPELRHFELSGAPSRTPSPTRSRSVEGSRRSPPAARRRRAP